MLSMLLAVMPVGVLATGEVASENAQELSAGATNVTLTALESAPNVYSGYAKFTPAETGFFEISISAEATEAEFAGCNVHIADTDQSFRDRQFESSSAGSEGKTIRRASIIKQLKANTTYVFELAAPLSNATVTVGDPPEWTISDERFSDLSAGQAAEVIVGAPKDICNVYIKIGTATTSCGAFQTEVASYTLEVAEGGENVKAEKSGDYYTLSGLQEGSAKVKLTLTFCGTQKSQTYEVVVKDYSKLYKDLTWNFDETSGVLTIGGTGAIPGQQRDAVGMFADYSPWKGHAGDVTKIVIQEGITEIGERAFSGYNGEHGDTGYCPVSIELPESVTKIGVYAFMASFKLTEIKLPSKLAALPEGLFSSCSALKTVTLPANLKTIGVGAFANCGVESITIPGGVTVGEKAFSSCTNLKDIYCNGLVAFAGSPGDEDPMDRDNKCALAYDTVTIHYPVGDEDAATYIAENSAKHEACEACSITWKQDYEPPKDDPCAEGHTWDNGTVTKAATCTEAGVKTYTCTVCKETKTEEIPATGHSFTEHKVLKESTTTTHGTLQYTCTACKKTVTEELPLNTFSDIKLTKDTEWYYAPTLWAVENKITDGMNPDAAEFVPEGLCNRAMVVTFLWRAAGRPEPRSAANPFVDVKDSEHTNWYYKAVLWAVENGITTGTDATHFSPEAVCNRAMVATFIWRANGKPAPKSTASAFADVKDSKEYYYQAVLWATENKVINGMGDGTFAPMADCQRAHVVAMLYRDAMR